MGLPKLLATKNDLRKHYSAARQAISPAEYALLNQQLLEQFKKLDLTGVQYLHIFRSIESRNEPDTDVIINWLKETQPNIILVYPRANFSNTSMKNYADDGLLKMAVNKFGIPQPASGTKVEPMLIDAVIVPLLAYCKKGYRVGYGKGFYDRFMAECKPEARFIGLSFYEPEPGIDNIDSYDIALHQCVTPVSIIRFG